MCRILYLPNILLFFYIKFVTTQDSCSNYITVDIDRDYSNILIPNIQQGDVNIRAFFSQAVALPENINLTALLQPNDDRATVLKNIENEKPIDFVVKYPVPNVEPRLLQLDINSKVICSNDFDTSHATLFYLTHFLPKETVMEEEQRKAVSITPLLNRPERPAYSKDNNNDSLDTSLPKNANKPAYPIYGSDGYSETPRANKPAYPIYGSDAYSETPRTNKPAYPVYGSDGYSETPRANRPAYRIDVSNDYLDTSQQNSANKFNSTIDVQIDVANSNKQNGCASNLKSITPFIFSDVLLQRGQFPWLAAIFQKRPRGLSFLCGGSLISTSTVISAAHCFVLSSTTANHVTVYLGHHDLESFDEEGSVLSGIKKLLIHPEYTNGKYSDADLALLTLKRPVTFTEFVQPICLWSESPNENLIINRSGLIAGWGSDESGNAVSPLAKLASARIVSEGECLRSSASLGNLTSSRTLCAGNRDDTGPCTGDSGGGLVIKHNDRWMLRGILSAGLTTQRRCDLREFVIYCDLAKHLPWILKNMDN